MTLLVAACALAAAEPAAAETWTVSAPGRAAYATVRTQARDVVVTARLGTGTRVITARVRVGRPGNVTSRRRALHSRFTTPAGKRRVHELHARVLTLTMSGGRRVDVLAARDGVAIRQRNARAPVYAMPRGAEALLQRYSSSYERPYRHQNLAAARGRYGYPALITAGATAILLSEAGLRPGQGAAHFTARRGRLHTTRADRTPDRDLSAWRFALFGRLGQVVESSLPLTLGRPSRIADTSWIRPGRVAWSWWSDGESPRSLARQQQFVDGAAARGWEYVLVDEGWDPRWVPELVEYAAARHVRILLWTHWRALRDRADRERLLGRWARWGVAGVKVDFLQSDRRRRIAVYDAIARAAARRRLLVNFHGATLPRGIQRTWPNVLTTEAVRGAEYARNGVVPAAHDVNLVFTRNVVGSMDYTPVAFSAPGRTTSAGHQLAQAVAFESGLQHLADTPESYAARPAADAVLHELPVAWDDTRLIDFALDQRATIARRAGHDWWVAGLRAGSAQTNEVPLTFLQPGRSYRATITTDDGADGLAVSERTVTSADTLTFPTAADGGFIVRLRP